MPPKSSMTANESTTLREESEIDVSPRRFRLGTFSSLRHLNFRYLWFGTLFMSGGQWIQQVTLGWLLYDLTGSSVLLGLLNGLRALPFLIASPIAGVAADRMDRKQLILATQYVLIMTTLAMGLLVASGILEVWHLFVFTLMTGVIWAFVDPVRQTLVPALVPREDLMNEVALNSAAFNLTKMIGPPPRGSFDSFFRCRRKFLCPKRRLYRRARVDLLDVHPPDAPGVDCCGWLPSLLHGHDQYDAPSDCSGPFVRAGDEHLCVGPRIDAPGRTHGGSQRPCYRCSCDRELHGIGGYTAGNAGRLARARGSRNRLGSGELSCQ